eukprot:3720098-Prymnesium_polylepis.1
MVLTTLRQVFDLACGLCSCAELFLGALLRRRHRLHVCALRARQSAGRRGHTGLPRRPAHTPRSCQMRLKWSDSLPACSIPAAVERSRKVRRHVSLKHQSGRDLRRVDSQNPSSGGAFGGENEASE